MKRKRCFVERIAAVLRYKRADKRSTDESDPRFQDLLRRMNFLQQSHLWGDESPSHQ